MEVKRPEREANDSPLSSAEVTNAWSGTTTPPVRRHGVVANIFMVWYLFKHGDDFTFYHIASQSGGWMCP